MFGNVNFFKPYFYFKKRYIYIFFYSQRTNTKRIKAIIPSVITAAFQDNPTVILFILHSQLVAFLRACTLFL